MENKKIEKTLLPPITKCNFNSLITIIKRCPNGYTNSRCSKKISEVPYAYRSSKAVFYAITVTIIICLIAIGAYYSIQRGYFQNMLPINLRTKLETKTSDDREQLNSTESNRSNIHFNKLIEDEIQNEVLA